MVWLQRGLRRLLRRQAESAAGTEEQGALPTQPDAPGPRLVHSDGSAADRREPARLGHLSRAKGDFSSYGRSQQAAIAEHLGDEALRAGRAAEAAAKYYEAVKLWPVFRNTQKAADAFLEAGHLEMALRLAENQLERARREAGHQAEETALAHSSLARVLVATDDLAGAEVNARAALRIDRVNRREKEPAHARHLATLGHVLLARGKLEDAAEALERALPLARKSLGAKHGDLGPLYADLAAVKEAQGQPKQAARFERLRQRLPSG